MQPILEDNAVVLFQGDSITDVGWDREDDSNLGWGYAALAAMWFSALYPEKHVRFLNRGIGGNLVKDLRARWEPDCLALKPTWVSILIGINDTWRRYDSHQLTTADNYERDYRAILSATRDTLNARLILMEPFLLHFPPDRAEWRVDLNPRIDIVRKLAREFDAILIPLDGIFAKAATQREMEFWAMDGVHPTFNGHALIAQAWLRAIGAQ